MGRDRHETIDRIARAGLIGIVREDSADRAHQVAAALVAGGVRVVEVTMTTPGAVDVIARLAGQHVDGDVLVGAGTVLDDATAARVVDAGATFVVSPHLPAGLVQAAHRHGAAAIPGAGTVHEAMAAIDIGADAVKLFPAGVHGLGWFRALRSVLPPVPLVPTGGISPADASAWITAGASAVGLGNQLTRGSADEITARAAELVTALSHTRARGADNPGDVPRAGT